MKIKYQRPKGSRITKGSYKYNGKRYDNFVVLKVLGYIWSEEMNKWYEVNKEPSDIVWSFENANIRNLKQAIRHLKKHDEIPKGTKCVLCSRWKGYNIYITK